MKKFKVPEIEFIQFSNDDIVTTSTCSPTYTCKGYYCPDCAQCTGSYTCPVFVVK